MPEPKFTRCPGCKTVFRVTPAQLALRNGQVRCGHCRAVFDANAQAISLAPTARHDFDDDDLALGPATVTLRSSRALEAAAQSAQPASREPALAAQPTRREPSFDHMPPAKPAPGPDVRETIASGAQTAASASRSGRRLRAVLYALAIPVLLVLLALQALVHFRDLVAARWPAAKPALVRLCEPLGCAIRPLRDIAGLSIDASDLQADPAHKGLLILSATLRNRAAIALAYPHLELTLTDANDRVVVRRSLSPADYAGGTATLATGFPANSEVLVKMFIDASATTQSGYRLYLFYP